METVTDAACADAEKVSLRLLNLKYGLPPGFVEPHKHLYPTIPSSYVGVCNLGSNHLYNSPADVQAMLVACLVVAHNAHRTKIPPAYGRPVNHGVQFGEPGFKALSSYKTL